MLAWKRVKSKNIKLCIYCGGIADTVEHIQPQSSSPGGKRRPKTAPACFECNVLLGNIYLWDIRNRALWLYDRYLKRGCSPERLNWIRGVALLDERGVPICGPVRRNVA